MPAIPLGVQIDASRIISGTVAVARLPVLVGATGVTNGVAGIVVAPQAGDEAKFLRGDATWQTVSSGSGTVTSVALTVPTWLAVSGSPITGAGTLAVTAATGQTANSVLASPDGSSGALGVRLLVANDIPALTSTKISDFSTAADARIAAAVILAPGSSTRNVIQPGASTYIPLTIKGAASQSADLFRATDSSDNILFSVGSGGLLNAVVRDAGTNAIVYAGTLRHNSSGTPAANYGTGIKFQGQSSTTADRDMGTVEFLWTTATDASRKSAFQVTSTAGTIAYISQESTSVFFGYSAGNKTIAQNTVIGYGAGASLTTSGIANTLVGLNAGSAITSGAYNTLVGCAVPGFTTGTRNVAIGRNTGYGAGTSSSYNVFVGSDQYTPAASNNMVAIGYGNYHGASPSVSLGSNIYAPSANTINFPLGYDAAIGAIASRARLEVLGHAASASTYAAIIGHVSDELITNAADRNFSSVTGHWTLGTNWTITGGGLSHTAGAAGTASLGNAYMTGSSIVNGATYRCTAYVFANIFGSVTFRLGPSGGTAVAVSPAYGGGSATQTFMITATADNADLSIISSSASDVFTMDDISLVRVYDDARFRDDGAVGFMGVTPALQQTGGAATAAGTYGATEQSMLQKAYDALRTFGFLS